MYFMLFWVLPPFGLEGYLVRSTWVITYYTIKELSICNLLRLINDQTFFMKAISRCSFRIHTFFFSFLSLFSLHSSSIYLKKSIFHLSLSHAGDNRPLHWEMSHSPLLLSKNYLTTILQNLCNFQKLNCTL